MNNYLHLENRHTGEILRIRRTRDHDGQAILLLEGSLPPGKNGPPLHVHFQQREEGVVKSGTLGVRLGDNNFIVPAGESTAFPAGTAHTWWNAGNDLLEFSGRTVPAVDLDRYLQAVFAVFNASRAERPSLFYLAHVLWRHRHTQGVMVPPPLIQRILFPTILLIGRVLGKYRGGNWPGSPASCPGAPEN